MQRLYWSLLVTCASVAVAAAQSFEDLNDRRGVNVYNDYTCQAFVRYTSFSDPYNGTLSGFTVNGALRLGNSSKGGFNYSFENPTLGDFIFVLANAKKWQKSKDDKSFGSGFFGWHQLYVNAIAKNKFILAPGLSMGDYIFGIRKPTGDVTFPEPNGYYFHIGPAVKASYLVSSKMWIEAYAHHDIGFKAGKPGGAYQNIKGYPRPHFFNIGANLYSSSRFFAGFRLSRAIDRGVNNIKATRVDVSAGYMIHL